MNGSHFDTQTQRERTCSLVHGTWRCVGAKIACAGACALMAGQLLLPSVALATECADSAAATGEVAAAPVTPTVAGDTAAPALASADSTASVADAAPAAPSTAEPQQERQDAPAATASDAAGADQGGSLDGAGASSADDAIMPCGVTDTTENPGGVKINTTVVDHYTDCVLPSNVTLVAAENEALESLTVENVKTDYAPGEAPRATATIPAADADKYEIAYECWEEMELDMESGESVPVAFWYSDPAKYTPGMKKIDHFEEGKFYMYSVELRLKDGFTVADDCDMNVNGHWTHHIKTVNGVFAPNADNMLCEQPIDEWRAIDVIEINGATTTFKAGDKPVFTADVPDGSHSLPQCEFWTGSDGSDVNSQKFWDQNITNHIDAFKPGVTYRYGLYFKSARGFYFTPDTKLKINGVECGYQVADSVSDSESGWIYTLWLNTDLTFTPEAKPASDPQPTPDPKPTPQPEVKPEAKPEAKPEMKPETKPVTTTTTTKTVEKTTPVKKSEAVLAVTGDVTATTVAALGIAGATVAAAGVAAAKRRKR